MLFIFHETGIWFYNRLEILGKIGAATCGVGSLGTYIKTTYFCEINCMPQVGGNSSKYKMLYFVLSNKKKTRPDFIFRCLLYLLSYFALG